MKIMVKKEGISKEERIKKKSQFIRIFRSGNRIESEKLRIFYKNNSSGISKFSIVTGKKLGRAVYRNRIKRVIKEVFRKNKEYFGEGINWIFIPREKWEKTDYYSTERLILDVIKGIEKKNKILKICGSQKEKY